MSHRHSEAEEIMDTERSDQAAVGIAEVFPYLCVADAAAAIDFYTRVFDARELYRLSEPDGRVGHAELRLGPVTLMLAEEYPECDFVAPKGEGTAGFRLHLHVDAVDALYARAIAAGATSLRPPTDEFYGERSARIRDPFGHEWLLGQHIEAVAPEEMQRRYTALFASS